MSLLTGLITQWMGICSREDGEAGSLFSLQGSGTCSIFQAVLLDFTIILIFVIILIFQRFSPELQCQQPWVAQVAHTRDNLSVPDAPFSQELLNFWSVKGSEHSAP